MSYKQGFVVILLLFVACNRQPVVYQKEHLFNNNTWQRFDFVIFKVPVQKGEMLNFSLSIKHLNDFPVAILPMNITFYTSDGEMRSREYHFTLKDKNGRWLSEKSDSVYQQKFTIKKEIKFGATGICKVRLEQKIPLFEIGGIKSISLIVEKIRI